MLFLVTAKDVDGRTRGKTLEFGNTRSIACKYWRFRNCIGHRQGPTDRRKLNHSTTWPYARVIGIHSSKKMRKSNSIIYSRWSNFPRTNYTYNNSLILFEKSIGFGISSRYGNEQIRRLRRLRKRKRKSAISFDTWSPVKCREIVKFWNDVFLLFLYIEFHLR